ncbi:hypothetical protein UlMin_032708 [Ulmus minor]
MEEKRRDAGTLTAAGAEFPSPEPISSRRRAGGHKRKGGSAGGSGSSSTTSKRATREKSSLSHPPVHNGPLTRARQGPSNLASASASSGVGGSAVGLRPEGRAKLARAPAGEALVQATQELNKQRELEALEAGLEADFEVIRSRSASAHVVPNHCGWFSWTNIHPIEERTLSSFFNGKTESRTPDMYLEIRNWIMKKFHANPSTQIELKDLEELEVGDLDARQEVMEFLDYWGLINFHPFPSKESAMGSDDGDGASEKGSLVDKLYQFETPQLSTPVVPKNNATSAAVPSRLFPESAIAEDLVRPEGPAVEYHCNSCSADCSRKRYHCQKQADFDLCTDCFNNGKFDSGMSSSDFILMEPGEANGLSGGNWTDQETLLLLEALELYKENWNEIAEHVATKTRTQCILHFVQMPIEDTFLDCDDDTDASSKENPDLASTDKDSLVPKDATEAHEGEASANEIKSQTSPGESSKEDMAEVKGGQETSKPEDTNKGKVETKTSQLQDAGEVKSGQEKDENFALKALKDAFEAVGYPLTPEVPLSFTEVGNPVMALAAFLARLVGADVATASAHSSIKSFSRNSPGLELATRHCFLLEDPPNDETEPVGSNSIVAEVANGAAQNEEIQAEISQKEELSDAHRDKKSEDCTPEEKRRLRSSNGGSPDKPNDAKDQDKTVAVEEVGPGNLDKSSNSEIVKDQTPSNVKVAVDLQSKAELPTSSVKPGDGDLGQPSERTETSKDVEMSEALPPGKNEPQQTVSSNSAKEDSHSVEASKDIDGVSDSLPLKTNEHQQPVTATSVGDSQTIEAPSDVEMLPSSQHSEKHESIQPASTSATVDNEASKDQNKDGNKPKQDNMESKVYDKIDKLKRAAASAISAAAVKAKLLANQEEDQIRQLSTLLVEKQLQKLETKLGFFNEMDNVVMRVREQLDRSRQRLYHERAQIIATRLGLPASSSRAMPPAFPANRVVMNAASSIPRPPMGMTPQRPPMSRPMGMMAPNPSVPFSTTTTPASSIQPPTQDQLPTVGTK